MQPKKKELRKSSRLPCLDEPHSCTTLCTLPAGAHIANEATLHLRTLHTRHHALRAQGISLALPPRGISYPLQQGLLHQATA